MTCDRYLSHPRSEVTYARDSRGHRGYVRRLYARAMRHNVAREIDAVLVEEAPEPDLRSFAQRCAEHVDHEDLDYAAGRDPMAFVYCDDLVWVEDKWHCSKSGDLDVVDGFLARERAAR